MTKQEKVFDILNKFEFFQGQRAGRELWNDKPKEVQDKDIADFIKDINYIRSYLQDSVVLSKEEFVELQKPVDELKERLHLIWAIGVDYDGFEKSESLKGLIDEMVELTRIESKDFVKYKQSKDAAQKQAIKEFADRLKENITNAIDTYYNSCGGGYYLAENTIEDIDELLKEYEVEE